MVRQMQPVRIAKVKEERGFHRRVQGSKKIRELEAKANEALRQIEDKEPEDDGYDIHSGYGIAFCGKDCFVKAVVNVNR